MAISDTSAPPNAHVRTIRAARRSLERAHRQRRRDAVQAARGQLRAAIEAANDAGVTWMQIGDLLGIARGNAYQQYRRRPARNRDAQQHRGPQ